MSTKAEELPVRPARYKFSIDDYHKMAEIGILTEDDRVELIEGEIVEMAPIGIQHAHCVSRLGKILNRLLPEEAIVGVQNPIRLDDATEPQPDVAVLKPRDYSKDLYNPGPNDVLLLIEVADTTLVTDRRDKLPLYALAGIPELWIVDLQEGQVEIYSQPEGRAYRQSQQVSRGQSIAVPGFPGVQLSVDYILGPA